MAKNRRQMKPRSRKRLARTQASTGATAASFHEGSRSEILADYLFSAWGTVTPARRQSDYGLDLYCTLTETIGHRARVQEYFSVQVKSSDGALWCSTSRADAERRRQHRIGTSGEHDICCLPMTPICDRQDRAKRFIRRRRAARRALHPAPAADNEARLILTDPPYNVPVAGHVSSGSFCLN